MGSISKTISERLFPVNIKKVLQSLGFRHMPCQFKMEDVIKQTEIIENALIVQVMLEI